MLHDALSRGRKAPKLPLPLGFRHPAGGKVSASHSHKQHAQNIWLRLRMWFGRYPHGQTDRQTETHTHRHTHTYSSQYFATTLAGEVKIIDFEHQTVSAEASVHSLPTLTFNLLYILHLQLHTQDMEVFCCIDSLK